MSGGSYNYLFLNDAYDIIGNTEDINKSKKNILI